MTIEPNLDLSPEKKFSLEEFIAKRLVSNDEDAQKLVTGILQSYRSGSLYYESGTNEVSDDLIPNDLKKYFVQKNKRFFLQKNDLFASTIITELKRLQSYVPLDIYDRDMFFQSIAEASFLTQEQKHVMHEFYSKSFGVLCGGPGTGKTFTASIFVRFLTNALDRSKKTRFKIALTAPTGKAALHLQSYLQSKGSLESYVECTAMTLHRALKATSGNCQLFSRKRIDADLVIVDEASMIDISLIAELLQSIGSETKLLFMGDPNQLPPVEMAGVFRDLAKRYGCFLTKCMRTENLSLMTSAQAILEGDLEKLKTVVAITDRFDENLVDELLKVCPFEVSTDPINPKLVFEKASQFRILNALRRGLFGLETLNQMLLEKVYQQCPKNGYWAIPILVTENVAHLNLFNGTFGVLMGRKKGRLDLLDAHAYFDENEEIAHKNPPPFELSFILSIHKSQGSEFDEVLALFPEGSDNFGKESLYTAATRAKKGWSIYARNGILEKMLENRSFQGYALDSYF